MIIVNVGLFLNFQKCQKEIKLRTEKNGLSKMSYDKRDSTLEEH